MALLRALLRSARRETNLPYLTAAPPPTSAEDDEILLDAPDDRLAPALVAAGRGEYEPAAHLLAVTREAAEWEHRDRYTTLLAAFARSRPEWARQWRATAPDDPDALLLTAQLAVDRGWASPARAELLAEAAPLITAAAEADVRDPVPWRLALDQARGTDARHSVFESLWEQAVRRSPHHYGCHVAALRRLAATGHDPHGECFDFAESAAQDAPPNALVQALPLRAAFGCLTRGTNVPRRRLDTAADRAITLSARFPAGDPWPAEVRNVLTYVLMRLERRPEALAQLRLIGPYATSFPWARVSDDPLGHFVALRAELAGAPRQAGRGGPLPSPRRPRSGRGGQAASGDH